jgi:hypothetical protein
MTGAIFKDDSTLADKRDAAIDMLMSMCPAPMRPLLRVHVINAIDNTSEEQLDALMLDAREIRALAEQGDTTGIATIARKYGATDQQVAQFSAFTAQS